MKSIHPKALALLGLLLLQCSLTALAEEPESAAKAADIMVHCAFLNTEVVKKHGPDEAFISVQRVKWFIGVAGDLTDEAYVIERIKVESAALKSLSNSERKEFDDQLNAGLSRCAKMDFSPAVLARIELMIKEKTSGK